MKSVLAISGSLKQNSSNQAILRLVKKLSSETFEVKFYNNLADLPHFNPDYDHADAPASVKQMRKAIEEADGVIICTPEYVFSIPSTLKNLIEWCVSTIVFNEKPTAIITASASGEKGHQELQLLMKTIGATLKEETTLLINGIKGKINKDGKVTDPTIIESLKKLITSFNSI